MATASFKWLLVERPGEHIAKVTIIRPEVLNALDTALLDELECCVYQLAMDTALRVVLLTGTGKSFVAGADIKAMSQLTPLEAKAFGEKGNRVFRQIELLPVPVIALVNGFALGGGCELSLACDIRIASQKALFGQPEVGLGITPGFGGTQRLPRLVGTGVAAELIYSARNIKAEEALRIGLVNQVVAPEELDAIGLALAERIAQQAPIAVRNAKQAIRQGLECPLDTALTYEPALFSACFATEDQKNGMAAFLQKGKAEYKGR